MNGRSTRQRPSLLQYLRRRRWLPRFALPLVLAAFFAAGLAHAAHLHKSSDPAGKEAARCELCLQLARFAPAPPTPVVATPLILVFHAPVAATPPSRPVLVAHAYSARAPPSS